jgi:type I restriction enzyme, S subunit
MALAGIVQASCPAVRERAPRIRFKRLRGDVSSCPAVEGAVLNCQVCRRGTNKIDAASVATQRTISLLRERRAALIAAAVTGLIEIPTATAI